MRVRPPPFHMVPSLSCCAHATGGTLTLAPSPTLTLALPLPLPGPYPGPYPGGAAGRRV